MYIPNADPFVFKLGWLQVRWYGLFMATSIAFGIWYLITRGRQRRVSEDFLYNLSILSVIGGILGSRLVYVATNPNYFLAHPGLIMRIDMGGLSYHGAIAGGVLTAWWYASRYRVPLSALLDLAVPGLMGGLVLVRFGNILNQEILGYPAGILGGARHPAQLYGSITGLIVLMIFARQTDRNSPDGYRFWSAVFWYSILRFITEFFRAQNPHFIISYTNEYLGMGAVTLTQWLTPIFVVGAWLMMRRAEKRDQRWAAVPGSPAYEPLPGDEEVPDEEEEVTT